LILHEVEAEPYMRLELKVFVLVLCYWLVAI